MSNKFDVHQTERIADTLRITEIFYSLQGEADTVGWPTVFVRLTGCPLRCHYCDTEYAFTGGTRYMPAQVVEEIQRYNNLRHITITGGEPLTQPAVFGLMAALCDLDYQVSLETSGALDIAPVDDRVSCVLDIKTPGSGEVDKNLWSNIGALQGNDQVKFVICNRADYDWAKQVVVKYDLTMRSPVWFSPSFDQIEARLLADWIVADQLPVRFQLQLHKILWNDARGR